MGTVLCVVFYAVLLLSSKNQDYASFYARLYERFVNHFYYSNANLKLQLNQ